MSGNPREQAVPRAACPPAHAGDGASPAASQTAENICRACSGTGRTDGEACPECGGTGKVTETVGDA